MSDLLGDLGNFWTQSEHAVEGTIHSIEDAANHIISLGVPSFSALPQLIQFFVSHGENPFTLIPLLAQKILSRGGDVAHVLEEMTWGFINEGPQNYVEKHATKIVTPIITMVQQHTSTAQSLADLHKDTIKQVKAKITALRHGSEGAPPLEGDFALALDDHFAKVEKGLGKLVAPLGGTK